MENLAGRMEENKLEIGVTEDNMVKLFISLQQSKKDKEYGKKERD